jgi:hypothetical protein
VATTGNDSNPGTAALPFATIQKASQVATSFDYQNAYQPNINIAAGTYNEGNIVLHDVWNMGNFGLATVTGAGIGSTIINAQGSAACFFCQSSGMANWELSNVSIDINGRAIRIYGGQADLFAEVVEFRDSSNSGNLVCMFAQNFGCAEMSNCTVNTTTFAALFQCINNSEGFLINTLTFPAAVTVTKAIVTGMQGSWIYFTPSSVVNAGGVTGPKLYLAEQSQILTNNGLISDVPGSTLGYVDSTATIASQNSSFPFSISSNGSQFARQTAGLPTSSQISSNAWTVVQDTRPTSSVHLLYNNAGTITEIGGSLRPANGNLNFYVDSAAGNDSNTGTDPTQPFRTIQHAAYAASQYDYQLTYQPTINLGAMTYNEADIALGPLWNLPRFTSGYINGLNATINAQSGTNGFVIYTPPAAWIIDTATIDCHNFAVYVIGGTADAFRCTFADTHNSGNLICGRALNGGALTLDGATTVTATTMNSLIYANVSSEISLFSSANLTLPVALTVTVAFMRGLDNCVIRFTPSSITNPGGVVGKAFNLHAECSVITNNGLITDVPGAAPVPGDCDATCALNNNTTGLSTYFISQFAGIPGVANVSAGTWTVVKDTAGGGVYVLYNDAGVIKKVALV